MNKVVKYLNQHLVGNAYDRQEILEKYSTDHSVLKITPKMVVIPETTTDIRRTVRFVNQLATKNVKLGITVRGAGCDKTGAAIGPDILVSMERMNHIQEIDVRSKLVRVQAGVTLGQLNSALSLVGLTLPVGANPQETIGGLISNFQTDRMARKYNGIYYYVDCLEAVVSTGDIIQTGRVSKHGFKNKQTGPDFESSLYRNIKNTIEEHQEVIAELHEQQTIDAAGYQMLAQAYRKNGRNFDLMPLFFGAQGTLGIITEVILRCEVLKPAPKHIAATFANVEEVIEFAKACSKLEPCTLDIYDSRILQAAVELGKPFDIMAKKRKTGYLLIAGFDDPKRKTWRKLYKSLKLLPESACGTIENEETSDEFNGIAGLISAYLNEENGERVALVDNFYIPAKHLAEACEDIKTLEQTFDTELPLMGSISSANYSIRPLVKLNTVEGRQFSLRFVREFGKLLKKHEGSITGGSSEGRVKAVATSHTDAELELYQSIKHTFDPGNIFNPGVKLGADARSTVRYLRTSYRDGIIVL